MDDLSGGDQQAEASAAMAAKSEENIGKMRIGQGTRVQFGQTEAPSPIPTEKVDESLAKSIALYKEDRLKLVVKCDELRLRGQITNQELTDLDLKIKELDIRHQLILNHLRGKPLSVITQDLHDFVEQHPFRIVKREQGLGE